MKSLYSPAAALLRCLTVPGLFGAFLAVAPTAPAHAETFVIAALDGYGIGDCLAGGASCGHIVADAWCEAHGLSRATAFGPAEDITASIGTVTAQATPGSYVVTCVP